jgi:capsular polysaccharide biosynthesis protein
VKDHEPMVALTADAADELRERLWAYEDFGASAEHPSIDVTGAFASLGFLWAALKRRRRVWLATGLLGFVIGCGVYVAYPPAYSASTTLLLTNAVGTDPTTAILTNQAMVESEPVAAAVVKQLGLSQSPGSLLAAYSVVATTDEVLQINVNAPSSARAVQEARAIASQFLKIRAQLLRTQEQQQEDALNLRLAQEQQKLSALAAQITQLGGTVPSSSSGSNSTQPGSGTPGTQAGKLEAKYTTEVSKLSTLNQQITGTIAEAQVNVINQVDGSQVLNPAAPGKHSKLKYIGYDLVTALFAGLVLGMGFVLVHALISDRLRRRDDIALALGAPVKLSVGPVKTGRLLSPRARAARERDLERISRHLRNAIPVSGRSAAGLAIVPVDDVQPMASAVVAVAESCAKEGTRVILADLTEGAPVARLLGVQGPGVRPLKIGDSHLIIVIPEPDDVAPSGPLRPAGAAPLATPPDRALRTAYQSADLVLTVAKLDPGVGGDHLATWATDAVAVITAGRTHGSRAYAVGEMLRLSGVRVVSSIIIGADEADDSLGHETAAPERVTDQA